MKGKIRKITSPSHTLESEIKELADENGQYLAKTGLGDTTTDVMDRDLVIFIQSEDNSKPVVFVEKSNDSLAALFSLIPSFKLDNQNFIITEKMPLTPQQRMARFHAGTSNESSFQKWAGNFNSNS